MSNIKKAYLVLFKYLFGLPLWCLTHVVRVRVWVLFTVIVERLRIHGLPSLAQTLMGTEYFADAVL